MLGGCCRQGGPVSAIAGDGKKVSGGADGIADGSEMGAAGVKVQLGASVLVG